MKFLKALSFLVGLAVLMITPFILPLEAHKLSFAGQFSSVVIAVGILTFACYYFFFAASGRRTRTSAVRRGVACILLLFQLASGGWLIWMYQEPEVLGILGPLLCLSIFLFVVFVLPANRERRYRPLRMRDPERSPSA